ncbi:MAG: 3-hydroxyacyl-ACP dehydratase FabZ [Gammaproteobacteria bacterium]
MALGMDINEIKTLLPHRYPMLLIDKVVDCVPNESLVGLKNVTINEPFFSGHFPTKPIMPGVLILEALAQATGVLAFYSLNEQLTDNTLYYLVGIDKARFKRPVEPGDQLHLEITQTREIKGIYKFDAVAKVEGKVVVTAEIMTAKQEVGS